MTKTVVVFSGGLDSTVLLHMTQREGEALALSFMYGQRHIKELSHATAEAHRLGVSHQLVDMTDCAHIFAGKSSQTFGCEVPEGHYADDNMKQTVVPNRNMIMLAMATGYAITQGADTVAYGAHAGDHAIYPDCRTSFVDAMRTAVSLADWHDVKLSTPFVHLSKGQVVRLGAELGVDFGATWSCYKGGDVHCGLCGTCVERRLAFEEAGVQDPTVYADGTHDRMRELVATAESRTSP